MKNQLFCVGNSSTNWSSVENPKTGLYGNVYDFAIDYEPYVKKQFMTFNL